MQDIKQMGKHALALLVALFACAVLAFSLTGCGQSDEDAIKQALDNELSILDNPGDDEIQQIMDEAGLTEDDMSQVGISTSDFISSWFSGFAYEIGDITVDGDSAQAEVTITCKQLQVILTNWQANALDNIDISQYSSQEDLTADLGESMMKDLNNAEPTQSTVTAELSKSDGEWSLTTSGENAIYSALLGDTTE